MSLTYVRADATQPQSAGKLIIAHVCNDSGGWGRGFVTALSKRSPLPERAFRRWFAEENSDFALGAVQFVAVADGVWVANMIGQHDIRRKGQSGPPPVRYEAIETALGRVAERALQEGARVQMPRIGCGLAGGKWEKIEPLIQRQLCERGVEVVVCDWD